MTIAQFVMSASVVIQSVLGWEALHYTFPELETGDWTDVYTIQ